MKLTGIRKKVFLDRYSVKDKKGEATEKTPRQMWRRVARAGASVEDGRKRAKWERAFYEAMEDFKYVPGGRILAGAGTGYNVTYYNCFVIPSPKDSRGGILKTLRQMVEIMAHGGGVGINLSSLRPRGTRVRKVNGFSSGPMNWAELFSVATKDIIQQGGCFAGDTLIMTHRGLVPVRDIVESSARWFAATHEGYEEVTAKFDNGKRAVFEVQMKSGLSVKLTAEHKLLTVDDGGHFYLKELADFAVGDTVVSLLGEWRDDIPYVSLNTTLPVPSKYSFGKKEIQLPKELTEELAFLVGVYDADGSKVPDEYSSNGKGVRIAIAKDRQRDLERVITAVRNVFGVEPKVKDGDGAVYNVCIYSRQINEFLALNNLLKELSVNVEVPPAIYTSPRRVVEAYIAGVFLGDGTNRGGKGGFRITTVSSKFASKLQLLLVNLGVASRIAVRKRRHTNWRTTHTVTVNGHRFMKRFLEIVSPYTQKAHDHPISERDGAFNWPFNLTDRFVHLSGLQRTIARTNPTTSHKTTLFLQERRCIVDAHDREDISLLASCIPDTVVSIRSIGQENVYDLEVDRTHLLSGNGFYTSNSRRGALMLMLWDWHPDIEEFITVKQDLSRINGANLSLCISDRFMDAVKRDKEWSLVFPDLDDPEYDEKWNGDLEVWKAMGKKVKVQKTVRARKMWDLIAQAAWRSAEPGVVFMERYNKLHNNWYWNRINCVNPCGEEGLPDWGVCNLGSINLAAFAHSDSIDTKGTFDFKSLKKTVRTAVRFQDNVVDMDPYIFEGIRKTQLEGERRIGLGTMGLGDALITLHLRYGSSASLKFVDRVYRTICDEAYRASVELSREKGAFPKFDRIKYSKGAFIKKRPKDLQRDIKKHGIRNSVLLMQAPTGTTSLLSGTTSGIEPVYEFEFYRYSRLGKDKIHHHLWDEWYKKHGKELEAGKVKKPSWFVSANDLTPTDHVRIQGVVQKYVDASISKTVNAPEGHTVEDVKALYTQAYELGCKGITYMREGSREGVLQREEKKEKEEKPQQELYKVKPRPMVVRGSTYRIETPVGVAYITINTNGNMEPLEIFVNVGKAGSDVYAMAEGLGRMVSLALRFSSHLSPHERIREIVEQLSNIGGARALGFGRDRIRSLPDAVAKVLSMHYKLEEGRGAVANGEVAQVSGNGEVQEKSDEAVVKTTQETLLSGAYSARVSENAHFDICPECGTASLVFEEGCKKCYSCAFSEC